MKYYILLIIILINTTCVAQKDTLVLIVPMKNNMIQLDNVVTRMLKYNKVSEDSTRAAIQNLSVNRLITQFSNYSFSNLQNDADFRFLLDSVVVLDQWNSFHVKKITESKGIEKIKEVNDFDPQSKYYGRVLNDNEIAAYKEIQKKEKFTFICFINKFETISRRPFSRITYICLHFEIYDQNFDKIYGGKTYWPIEITKTMYYSVFTYSIQKAFDDFYHKINVYISMQ